MSKKTDRLELLSSVQASTKKIKLVHESQADALMSIIFDELGNKNVQIPRNPNRLIGKLEEGFNVAQDVTYDALTAEVDAITRMSAQQVVSKVPSLAESELLKYLNLSTEMAIKYVTQKSPLDGLQLSERLWNLSDRQAVINGVYRAIKEGWTSYQLAEFLRNNIANNIPWKNLLRVAKTELTSAYSMGQVDTAQSITSEHPEFIAYAIIELSPYHLKLDICDVFAGEYLLEKAPVTPFHDHCMCIYWTDIRFRKEPHPYDLTSIEANVEKYRDWIKDGLIYIPPSVSKAFNIGVQTKPNSGMSTGVNSGVIRSIKNRKETTAFFPDVTGNGVQLEVPITVKEARFIKKNGIKLDSFVDDEKLNGYYSPNRKLISIRRRSAPEEEIKKTFLHELGHAIDMTKQSTRLSSSPEFTDLLNNTGVINGFLARSRYKNLVFRYKNPEGDLVSITPTIEQVKQLLDTRLPVDIKTVTSTQGRSFTFTLGAQQLAYFDNYAKSNAEIFADMYSQFRLDPEGMAKNFPNLFKYVAKLFNEL